MELANEGIPEELLREFKKVGSNLKILDRTVLFEPRRAWKTLSDSGLGGGDAFLPALCAEPIFGIKPNFDKMRRMRDSVTSY